MVTQESFKFRTLTNLLLKVLSTSTEGHTAINFDGDFIQSKRTKLSVTETPPPPLGV